MPRTCQPQRRDEGRDIVAHGGVNERVSHDALLDVSPAGFELRLDQRQQVRRRLQAAQAPPAARSLSEMKLTSMVTKSGRSGSSAGSSRRISVALDGYDLRSLTQA